MSSKFYPNGAGGSLGDQLDTCRPLITSGNIWYVSSLIGTDAASPAGQNREKPLATLAQAVTNAASDDIIAFLAGHTETLTAAQTINKSLTLVGEGTAAGKPSVSFKLNSGAAASVFTVAASDCEFRNLYLPESVQTVSANKIAINATLCRVVGCYFECGAKDTGFGILASASMVRIQDCIMVSTGTSRAAQPNGAIKITGSAVSNVELLGVVVSAGTVGFSNYSAVDLSAVTTLTKFKALGVSLLLGADMDLPAGWTGYCNVQTASGGSRVSAS